SSNPDHAPTWYVNIKTVEWKTPPPVKVGSQIAFVARFLGRRMAYTYEVVELLASERFVMRTAQGPFPMETTYTWETTADGDTRTTLRNRGTPTGFSKLVAPFMGRAAFHHRNRQGPRLHARPEDCSIVKFQVRDSGGSRQPRLSVLAMQPSVRLTTSASAMRIRFRS